MSPTSPHAYASVMVGSSPGADVGEGEPSPGACGKSSGLIQTRQIWGASPSPGADVAGIDQVPVQMWPAAHLLVRPVRRVVDVHVADVLPLDLSSGRRKGALKEIEGHARDGKIGTVWERGTQGVLKG